MEELQYFGHRINSTGIHPTEEKEQAIKQAPRPENTSQLHAFLGLMDYYSKFIPQVASQLAPLYKLLQKNSTWNCTDECNQVFHECNPLLTSDAVLAHYDIKKPLKLSCDAFQYGLGIDLSHVIYGEEYPIAFAS